MADNRGRTIRELSEQRAREQRRSDRDDIISSPRYTDQLINAHPDTVRVQGEADRRVREIKNRRVNNGTR